MLDATSLKKCRLINKTFQECIDNCSKYNKYWILNVSGWPVTKDQEFVNLYIGSNMKFGKFISNGLQSCFTCVPKMFEKLGKTVTSIKYLPFNYMDLKTIKSIVANFDKVEDLKLNGNHLLFIMERFNIVWPSIKRLTIFCGVELREYSGNFSEFPNVEEISIEFFNFTIDAAIYMIQMCPEKITGIQDKLIALNLYDPFVELCKVPNLTSLKKLKFRYQETNEQRQFLQRQTNISSCVIWSAMKHNGTFLPQNITSEIVTSLTVHLKGDSEFDLRSLSTMPNLKKFRIFLTINYDLLLDDETQLCFLDSHEIHPNKHVTELRLDKHAFRDSCFKCIRSFVSSFANLTKLYFDDMGFTNHSEFYQFWKVVNNVMKKTGISQRLTCFNLDMGDSQLKINCEEYKFFKVMTFLPNVKELRLYFCLKGLSQNTLKTFCDKCPALQKLELGVTVGFDFKLSGFLIHQLKDLKKLKLSDCSYKDKQLGANVDIIDVLLNVPLKLWVSDFNVNSNKN